MGAIEELFEILKKHENGEKIALLLLDYLSDERKSNLLITTLASLRDEIAKYEHIKLTPAEKEAYKLVLEKGCVTFEDLSKLSVKFASFKHRSHTSVIMNSLVEKGLIGKIKLGKETIYATPKEAVLWALKEIGKMPTECNPKEISELTGLPIVKVLEVLDELL